MDTPTNPNYRKKKQPAQVRANLIEAAIQVVVERGFAGLTLDLVALKAGVSKGGLLHHFSSKQALIDGLYQHLLDSFDESLQTFIDQDPEPRGRFHRAYIKATLTPPKAPITTQIIVAFALVMIHDAQLCHTWDDWFSSQLKKHGVETDSVKGNLVRYAADGIWVEICTGSQSTSETNRQEAVQHLIEMTYEIP